MILENLSQFLYLASGVKNGEGFWIVGIKNSDENILDDTEIVDCHRKELIGIDSAKDILFAINLNLENLSKKLLMNNYLLDKPSKGISFNIPLDVLVCIFDFWLEAYSNKEIWEICLGLLKVKKRLSLFTLINSGSLKGKSKKWAIEIEKLHSYTPNSVKSNNQIEPMWK